MKYDWVAIQKFYDSGHSTNECAERYGFSNGAWHHALKRGHVVAREPRATRPRDVTRRGVQSLLAAGLSQAEVSKRLDVGAPTVCFHARRLGVPANPEFAKRLDWAEIRAYYEAGHSMRDCLKRYEFSRSAWSDAIRRGAIVPRPRLEPIEQILTTGRCRNRSHVKWRLLLAGLKKPRCESCGVSEWCGRSLSLELHHVNGDGRDNRLENLRLLCPNCHSQTDTWGARNKGRRRLAPALSSSATDLRTPPAPS